MFDPDAKREDAYKPDQFSGSLIYSGQRKPAPGDTYLPDDGKASLRKKTSFLDSVRGQMIHSSLMGHYIRELDRQAENRMQMAMDEDFYDHIQFTDEELEILAERGQAPLVFNMIHTSVNWVLGSQRRSTMDYRILARTGEGVKAAERKTELLKHVGDCSRFEHENSMAFASAVKAGMGWLEVAEGNADDPAKVVARAENWRSMIWDSTSVRYDLEDARYLMRVKWLDVDLALGLWQHRRGVIEQAVTESSIGLYMLDDLGDDAMDSQEIEHFNAYAKGSRGVNTSHRDRVRVIECWFKRMVPDATTMKGGQFTGELFDPWSPGHVHELNTGMARLVTRPREVTHCALFTDSGLLDIRRSPYRHNRYPFTPVWGYRRARDNMPYGIIRGLRDIQRDLNRRAAKALHHLSTTRVMVQEGAVSDIEELRDEAARPDAVITYKAGMPAPQVETERDVAAAHIELMSRDAEMIQAVSGVTDENLGRKTNAASGKAILARQDQGQLATSTFFDNLALSRMIHGEKTLVMIEQFYTEEDQFRVTDSRGNPNFVSINDGASDNAIAVFKADFVVSEEDWRATSRQAQAEQLLELAGKLSATAPDMVIGIMDLIVEALDVPHRDELVKRIRNITGAEDPDADPNNPTPEMIEKQQAAAAQQEMEQRAAMAELSNREAEAMQKQAMAQKAQAEAQKIMAEAQNAATGIEGQVQQMQQQMAEQVGALKMEQQQQVLKMQQAFQNELLKVKDQAQQQAIQYQAQLAQITNQAEQAKAQADVELAKAQIEARTEEAKAQADAAAKVRVAEIEAESQERTDKLQETFNKALEAMSKKIEGMEAIATKAVEKAVKEAIPEDDGSDKALMELLIKELSGQAQEPAPKAKTKPAPKKGADK